MYRTAILSQPGPETMLIELPDLPYPADALELLNWEFAECLTS
jgi:hypothetical protein